MPFQLLRTRQTIDSTRKNKSHKLRKGDSSLSAYFPNNDVNSSSSLSTSLRTLRRETQDPKAARQTSFKSIIQYLLYFSFVVVVWIPVALLVVPAIKTNRNWLADAVASLRARGHSITSFQWINSQWLEVSPTHDLNTMEMRIAKVEDYLGGPRRHRRDFALRGAGARILDELTSPTHGYMPSPSRSWFKRSQTGIHNYEVNLPVILLEDQVYVGECWEFSGSRGHVAIVLPEVVQINGLSVTQVDPVLLSKVHVERAPKNITLWGLVDLLHDDGLSSSDQTTFRTASSFAVGKSKSTALPETHRFLPLLNILIDIKSRSFTQYFEVTSPLARQWMDTVIVEVNENWGAATTCMYHVGIHGATRIQ